MEDIVNKNKIVEIARKLSKMDRKRVVITTNRNDQFFYINHENVLVKKIMQ